MKKEKVLVLKEEYVDTIVSNVIPKLGLVTFDTAAVDQSEYLNYERMGFGHCFNEVEQEALSEDKVQELRAEELERQKQAKKGVIVEQDEFEEEDGDFEGDEFEGERFDGEKLAEVADDQNDEETEKETVERVLNSIEEFEAMDWADLKELAKKRGMSIGGRTKRESVINFLIGK